MDWDEPTIEVLFPSPKVDWDETTIEVLFPSPYRLLLT